MADSASGIRPVVRGQSAKTKGSCYCGFCPPERKHCYYRRTGESFKYHVRFRAKERVRSAYRLTHRAVRTLLILEGPAYAA